MRIRGWVLAVGLTAPLVAPAAGAAQQPIELADDRGGIVRLAEPPTRIVSLVPSVTEILFALGAGDRLVGRSVWDDQPLEVHAVPSVGDALRADPERVLARRPDLVILYAGPDNASTLDQLERLGVPVFAVRIDDFGDLDRNIARLGILLGRPGEAGRLRRSIETDLRAVGRATAGLPRPSVYYDVAWPPAITIGRGSYLDSLITLAGGRNVFGDLSAPSPRVSLEAIAVRDPDLVLLPGAAGSVSPGERPGWQAVGAVAQGRVRRVDAELLHRLGPRVGSAARALALVLHPELRSDALPTPVGEKEPRGRAGGAP